MQPASLRSLFLVNALLFPYAADGIEWEKLRLGQALGKERIGLS
jgi:hypothetical protein